MAVLLIMATAFPFSPFSSCTTLAPSTSYSKIPKFRVELFSPWSGLKNLGISTRVKFLERRKRIPKGKGVFASLFGVGAPEALVIGVVALLVFGPKGLAEVARNLGKTLRAFQPTIRELQDVSREFKTTLEREIGLDEISSSVDNSYNSSRSSTYSNLSSVPKAEDSVAVAEPKTADESPSASKAYTSEEYLKVTEEQLKKAQDQVPSQSGSQEQQPEGPVEQPATDESASSAPGLQSPGTET